ncbi:MAG: DNA-binding response regulator [Dyadobacter sp. 50-39]|uniref:LytR/AlgR family response regulator transcription factor n=1 Tax=Dyadobacter sp. 50-39 TaxID=1895756 RepID=UPI00095E7A34|nr:LytTR family DNA-binding domain-containing protein [Dyadobacter sp. 50-39]OJV20498.1 MAG: DNA-binding response regulator [Dyadobacter sp. 50-39]
MKFKTIIVDDEPLARHIVRTMLTDDPEIEIVDEATNGNEATLSILHHKPEIVFLDIQMSEADGFQVISEVWQYHQPAVIFTTAFDQYAIRAFEVAAVDYLLKPFTEIRFRQALARTKANIAKASNSELQMLLASLEKTSKESFPKRILVKERQRQYFVAVNDIFYCEADGNYIHLFTATKKHTVHGTLGQMESQLDPSDFVRINRSNIVNLAHVKELESYFNSEFFVTMNNAARLKWTRFYRDNLDAFYSRGS